MSERTPNQVKVWRSIVRSFWTPSRPDKDLVLKQDVGAHLLLSDWRSLDPSPRQTRLTWEGRTTLASGVGPAETAVAWEINGPWDGYILRAAGVRTIPPLDVHMGVSFSPNIGGTALESVTPVVAYFWPQTPPVADLTLTLRSLGSVPPTETTGGSYWEPQRPLIWALDPNFGSPPYFIQAFSFPEITVQTTLIFNLTADLPRADWIEDARLNPYL